MYDLAELKNKITVLGVGNTPYGNFPETDDYGLAAQAFRNAVADCGIDKNRIDGLLVCRIPYYARYARMGEILGLNPRWTMTLPGHGRMSGMGIIEASMAIAAGPVTHAALLYANIGRSRQVNCGGDCNNAKLGAAVNVVFDPVADDMTFPKFPAISATRPDAER